MTDRERAAWLFEKVIDKEADAALLGSQDVTILMKLAGRLKKHLAQEPPGEDALRIAVLGSYSIQHFTSLLRVFLRGMGIDTEIYEGEYDGIRMDVMDDDSPFYRFSPRMVLLLMDHRDIRSLPSVLEGQDEISSLASQEAGQIADLWKRIGERLPDCHIFQTNIALPPERPLGNLEGFAPYSRHSFYRLVNDSLRDSAPRSVTLVDMEYLSSYLGKKSWFDYPSYFLTKAGFSPDCLPAVCSSFANLIGAIRGRVYKCVVLDLDNTLWGGVVGDLGWDGIELDPHNAIGEAYRHFQSYLLALKRRGVLLAVCSKNEESVAKEPFEKNRDMILHLEDIACFVANWDDKAGNINAIARTLNIGVDSLVFVDDNPAERDIVRRFLPQVLTVELPEDPAYYARALDETGAFSWLEITPEDVSRAGTYAANAQRAQLQESFVDYDEYLKALEMRAWVGAPGGARIKRFVQLINKSNQFNLTTLRCTVSDIDRYASSKDHITLYGQLSDRFGDNGIVSLIIGRIDRDSSVLHIVLWLMSCRVLKRDMEYAMLDEVTGTSRALGLSSIYGYYLPTAKNGMVREFYKTMGFEQTDMSAAAISTGSGQEAPENATAWMVWSTSTRSFP